MGFADDQTVTGRRAKRPTTAFAGPYGHPVHPLLVTVPIGAWVASLVFDLASRWTGHTEAFALGARWLVGLGVLGALVAAGAGLLDLALLPGDTRVWRIGIAHASLNLTATVLFGISLAVRSPAAATSGAVLALSVGGLGLLTAGGWLGGMLTYRYGVRVAEERDQRHGFEPH